MLLVIAWIARGADSPGSDSAATTEPSAQDVAQLRRARKAKLIQLQQSTERQDLLDLYRRGGHTDGRWDDAARAAMSRFATLQFIEETNRPAADLEQAERDFKAAVDNGCDDPMVLYCRARLAAWSDADRQRVYRLMQNALGAVEASTAVPHSRKAVAHALFVEVRIAGDPDRLDRAVVGQTELEFKAAVDHLNAALEHPDQGAARATADAREIIRAYQANGGSVLDMFARVSPALEKAYAKDYEPLLLKGDVYNAGAWEARGAGGADTVTDVGANQMAERLAVAQDALEQAYKVNPSNSAIARAMIMVARRKGLPRADMEMWFVRAMDADPDDYKACTEKLTCLEPKWGGSMQDMLEFGRQCLREANWSTQIPFILIEAHIRLAQDASDIDAYYQSPNVWDDIRSVYDTYLQKYPDSKWARSGYAKWACTCGQWQSAVRLFDQLNDHPDLTVFNGSANYEYVKRKATKNAAAQAPASQPPTAH
jgi:hypothetical protein